MRIPLGDPAEVRVHLRVFVLLNHTKEIIMRHRKIIFSVLCLLLVGLLLSGCVNPFADRSVDLSAYEKTIQEKIPEDLPWRGRTQVSHIAGRFFTIWATREAKDYWSG